MVRELLIFIYLSLFQITFRLFKLFPRQNKTVCVASFGDNIYYTTHALRKMTDEKIIILKEESCKYPFDHSITTILPFTLKKPFSYLKSIYHLATGTTILVDNYFGFLAVTKFKKGTTCIQLWHAAGAIKKFGLLKPSTNNRSSRSHSRFVKVYNRFDYTIVGSERMATIFQESFELTDDRILRSGIPRTDFFYNKKETEKVYLDLINSIPIIRDKKVILYAPTFRDNSLSGYQINLDFQQLYKNLSKDYVLFIKVHPAVSYEFDENHKNFVYDVSDYYDVNHLLLCTDILITDYSSIPFEFSLLEKPMIFYAYDKDTYKATSGLIDEFETHMPGPVVSTTEEIIRVITHQDFEMEKIKSFAEEWNQYSKGRSSHNLSQFIIHSKSNKKQLLKTI